MSVLKKKRSLSKAEFINVAHEIYIETIDFLTKLSARYSRLMAEPIAKLAGEVQDNAEKANSIFPSNDQRKQMREAYLLKARASLMALDRRLGDVYEILSKNPQGCFTNSKGDTLPASEATQKLDKRAQRLGELIDRENELLKGAVNALSK